MTNVSNLGLALSQLTRLKDQKSLMQMLSTQLSTGKKTQRFSELKFDALKSERNRADLSSTKTYQNNITQADNRMKLMLLSIEEFQKQAKSFDAALAGFSKEGVHQEGEVIYYDDPLTPEIENTPVGMTSANPDIDFETLRDLASNLFNMMVDLLNKQDSSGRYLLGGTQTQLKPLEDNGLLDSAVSSLITGWKGGTITTESLIADLQDRTTTGGNTDAITDSIIGYNPLLSAGNVGDIFVRVSQSTEVKYTALANDKAFSDILVGLSFFKNENLPPIADTYLPGDPQYPGAPSELGAPGATLDEMKENFYALFDSMSIMVNKAIDSIDTVRFEIESARARIDTVKQRYVSEQHLLESTIADIEDADINEVAVKINTLALQIDASYRVTARIQELSLVNFL